MKAISIVVALLGIAAIVIGAVFVGLGMSRNNELVQAMRQEKVALGIEQSDAQAGRLLILLVKRSKRATPSASTAAASLPVTAICWQAGSMTPPIPGN